MSADESAQRSSEVLAQRFVAVEQVALQAGERIPTDVAAQLHEHLDAVRDRLAAGVDHTVVALVGGTGSGKSSLFNVLTGINFAEVGVKRPTTSQPLACVWGDEADQLLDHLGVEPEKRYQRESELDAGTEDELHGLVLIDVPDHDSVAEHHRVHVDRIVPLADVLIWVLDPQKYADAAVHTQYLQELGGHERSLMVVLNKIDTVPEVAVPSLIADIGRLLERDGLEAVPVRAVSTVTDEGIAGLRDVLAQVTQTRSAAAVRAAVDLRAAGDLLAPTVADAEPRRDELPVAEAAAILAEAAEVPELQDRVRERLLDVQHSAQLPEVRSGHSVDEELVESARERIIKPAQGQLPQLWAKSVAAAVPLREELSAELVSALRAVPLPQPPRGLQRARKIVSVLFALLLIVFIGWAAWLAIAPNSAPGGGPNGAFGGPNGTPQGRWRVPFVSDLLADVGYAQVAVPLMGAVVVLVIWLVTAAILGTRLRAARDSRAREYGDGLRAAAASLVGERIVGPAVSVHNSHREVREVIERVRAELAGRRPAEVVHSSSAQPSDHAVQPSDHAVQPSDSAVQPSESEQRSGE